MEAKATGKVGPCARGGKKRGQGHAADHAFAPAATLTPVGICLPTLGALFVYGVTAKGTSACRAARRAQWGETVRARFTHSTTLGLNLANGPENHRRRTPFMQRLVALVPQSQLTVRRAYSPP
jgi:hypothetical protein